MHRFCKLFSLREEVSSRYFLLPYEAFLLVIRRGFCPFVFFFFFFGFCSFLPFLSSFFCLSLFFINVIRSFILRLGGMNPETNIQRWISQQSGTYNTTMI